MASNRSSFEQLLDKFEPAIKAAFLAAIAEIKSRVSLKRLVEWLQLGDIHSAIAELRVTPAAFAEFRAKIAEAYAAGGQAAEEQLAFAGPFDFMGSEAMSEAASLSLATVNQITGDMNAGLADHLGRWLSAGVGARTIVTWLLGSKSRVTGLFIGGLVGLSSQQMQRSADAAAELRSGDPAKMANYLKRKLRDVRSDRSVRAAADARKAVMSEDVARLLGQYQQNMRTMRARLVGETETLKAVNVGLERAIRAGLTREGISADRLTKTWNSQRDKRVRHTHQGLDRNVIAFDHRFLSDSGAMLRFPGDPEAPANEIAGCRCYLRFNLQRD